MKIKMSVGCWWNYTDRERQNYAKVVFLTMVLLRIQELWDVSLREWFHMIGQNVGDYAPGAPSRLKNLNPQNRVALRIRK
jgi:hypothetical protein